MRRGRVAKFTVYRKPTNNEDYVHFYSGHSERVKNDIVIVFFLRAFCICNKEFLQVETRHIFNTFEKLKYRKGYLIRMKQKAEEIRKQKRRNRDGKEKKSRGSEAVLYRSHTQSMLTRFTIAKLSYFCRI